MTKSYQSGTLAPLIPKGAIPHQKSGEKTSTASSSRKMMPLIPESPPAAVKPVVVRNPLEVGLLNLSGLGLGYLFTKRWVRWIIYFLISVALVILAFLTKAHKSPVLWAAVFILFPLWMAFDGWRLTRKTNRQAGKSAVPWKTVGWVVGGGVLLVVIGIYFGYSIVGKTTFNKGLKAYETSDCTTAEKYFQRVNSTFEVTLSKNIDVANVKLAECAQIDAGDAQIKNTEYQNAIETYQGYLATYPDNPPASTVKEKIAEAYLDWGIQLRTNGSFEDAISKFTTVSSQYAFSNVNAQIPEAIATTYLQWAQDLRSQHTYADAIAKYQTIISQYPNSTANTSAVSEIVKTYAEWANDLRSTQKFQDAIDKFAILETQYPQTPEGKSALTEIGKTYIAWGEDLIQKGDFLGAMAEFDTGKQNTTDSAILSGFDQGMKDAMKGLSEDSGIQGQQVVADTLTSACNGKPATSPAVGMGKGSEPGAALFCDTSEVSLPSDLTAVKPSNFLYVLKFSSSTNAIETCHYESGYSLTRYQDFWTVTMISTLTGKVTHSQQFAGSYPDACPSSRYFTIGDYGDSTSGGPPGEDAVIAWLRQTLK